MLQYTLKQEYRDRIFQSQTLKGIVADALGVKTRSIERYCEKNHPDLARPEVLDKLRDFLKLSPSIELLHSREMSDTTTDL